MSQIVRLEFSGPFQWLPSGDIRSIFKAAESEACGIYLWTVGHADGDLVLYVGETGRPFRTHFREHLRDQLAGVYTIYEPDALRRGVRSIRWRGIVGKNGEPGGLPEFATRLAEFAPILSELASMYRFHLAPTSCEDRLRKRVEASVAKHVKAQVGVVGEFFEDGIRYDPRLPKESPIRAVCASASSIQGLPLGELEA